MLFRSLPRDQLSQYIRTACQQHRHDGPRERLSLAALADREDNVEQHLRATFEPSSSSREHAELSVRGFDPGPDGAAEDDGEGGLSGALEVDERVAEFCRGGEVSGRVRMII